MNLLWYYNHDYYVYYRFDKKKNWVEWHPENSYDPKAMYKFVSKKTWETVTCGVVK